MVTCLVEAKQANISASPWPIGHSRGKQGDRGHCVRCVEVEVDEAHYSDVHEDNGKVRLGVVGAEARTKP